MWMTQLSEVREETDEPEKEQTSKHRFLEGFVTGVLAALVCVTCFTAGYELIGRKWTAEDAAQAGAEILSDSQTADKLKEVQNLIQQKYLSEVDGSELSDYLFRGVAAGLGDAYARYYTKEELASVQESNEGAYYGIGATLSQDAETGELLVSAVYEGCPAQQAGLLEGDYLLRLGETELTGMDLSDVITMIRESEGTFSLTVLRDEEEITLEMACGQVEMTTVTWEIRENDIGYIRITEFDSVTVEQFKTAVDELILEGTKGIVMDLRDNPGGLLDSVCDMLDYLLPEGLIVYTEDRDGTREEYTSDDTHSVSLPMAVLVNGNSASASEIFAGALQDYGMGVIIGMPTYGKGVVQNTYLLSDGSAFKLTVEKYYTPNGQDIDGNGITPDITVEEDASQERDLPLETALEVLEQ
jgi:carboxyl-terminal processing protease